MARFTLKLSKEIDDRLNEIAALNGITKADAMRRAFALLAIADSEKRKGDGRSLGIVRELSDRSLVAVGRVLGA